MADIRDIIDAEIKANGRREISGTTLNSVLNAVVTDYDSKVGDATGTFTVSEVRALGVSSSKPEQLITTDFGGGTWYRDSLDTTSTDNTGTVLVTSAGDRYKRLGDVISVENFGARGDGIVNDTAPIQLAINSGAAVINFTEGKTYLTDRINVLLSNITIKGLGATIKLLPGFSSYQWLRVASPTKYSNAGVSIPLTVGQHVINTALSVQMAPGDIVRLDGPQRYQDQAAIGDGGTYNYGLYTRVQSISGDNVTIEVPSRFDFTATSIFIYDTVESVTIDGLTFDTNGFGNVSVANFEDTATCEIKNCKLLAVSSAVGIVLRGINLKANMNYIRGFNNFSFNSTGYGISCAGHNLSVNYNDIANCKHTIASGARAFLCESIHYTNNIIHNSLGPGIDMHANILGGTIVKNTVYTDNDVQIGIQSRGSGINIQDNVITMTRSGTSTLQMFGIRGFELFDGNAIISGNKIYVYNDFGTVSPIYLGQNTNTIVTIQNLNIFSNYSNNGNYSFEGIYGGGITVYRNTLDGYKAETGGGFNLRGTIKEINIYDNDIYNRYTGAASLNFTLDTLVPANLDQQRFVNFYNNRIYVFAAGNNGRVIYRSVRGSCTDNKIFSDFSVAYIIDISTNKENYIFGNKNITSSGTITTIGNYATLPTPTIFFVSKFAALETSTTIALYYCEKTGTSTYVWKLTDKLFNPVTGDFTIIRTGVTAQKTIFTNTADSNLIMSQSPVAAAKGLKIRATTDDLNTPATGGSTFVSLQVQGATPLNALETGVNISGILRVLTSPITSSGTYRILTRDVTSLNVEQIDMDLVLQRKITVDDSLTTAQTSATLNAAYPYANYLNIILARNVTPGMMYVRVTTTVWLAFTGVII